MSFLSVSSVALIVLDGWGLASPGPGNGVELADTPVFDELIAKFPNATLLTDGRNVGLPDGQMGNSEVGHLNLGAGAIVNQDLTRIDLSIETGEFARNGALTAACDKAKAGRGRLHMMGLVSGGGVHASIEHLDALLELASAREVPEVVIHVFSDGRDTLPTSGLGYVGLLEERLPANASIGSVTGRYFAMDRDRRWDRVKLAWDALVHWQAEHSAQSAAAAIEAAYERGETDEFIQPTLVVGADGMADGRLRDGDQIVYFNFRPDRARELTMAIGESGFSEFERGDAPAVEITTLTEYREGWPYPVAFAPARPEVTLASVIADAGGRQLHVAETEKYPHVTYFFNGGKEEPWKGEERCLVQSPKEVATYDLKPEMSAFAAAGEFAARWRAAAAAGEPFKFGVINFANPDMVGHSGVIPAVVKAVEVTDQCLGRVVEAVTEGGGVCLICADHGNAEQLLEPDGSPNTAHSTNPVPFIVTADGVILRERGILADVAPTVLALLGWKQPAEMSGNSMIAGP